MLMEPRSFENILCELCLLIDRRHLLTKHLFELINANALPETVKTRVFGAVEFVVAEALARILNVKLIVNPNEEDQKKLPKQFILWNGVMSREDDIIVFEMSGPGMPDIEHHYNLSLIHI